MEGKETTRMTAEYREIVFKRMSGTVKSKGEPRYVKLNGSRMKSVQKTHAYISRKLNFLSYYGNNLDALYDMLSTLSEPTVITIKKVSRLRLNLGDYAEPLLKTFRDAKASNTNIDFIEKE